MAAVTQGSAEWLEQRKGKISGTAVGVLEQCNPHRKPEQLVRDMVRDLAGAPSEFKTSPAVEHGTAMEPVAKAWYEKAFGVRVDETDFVVHPMYSFLGASPDGLVGIDGSLEIKCPYPRWTKAPYSVFDDKKLMYLRQCQLVMEVLDVEWIDFLCYLAPNETSHPEYNIERIHREQNWLHEPLSRSLLPAPDTGTIPRIDLYVEWHEYIMSEFESPTKRKAHTDDMPDVYEVVQDEDLTSLTNSLRRRAEIQSKISVELAELEVIDRAVNDLKKVVAEKHRRNVTDGETQLQVINRKGTFNYREAFLVLGGDAALLAKGLDVEEFRSASNTRQIKVKLGGKA